MFTISLSLGKVEEGNIHNFLSLVRMCPTPLPGSIHL